MGTKMIIIGGLLSLNSLYGIDWNATSEDVQVMEKYKKTLDSRAEQNKVDTESRLSVLKVVAMHKQAKKDHDYIVDVANNQEWYVLAAMKSQLENELIELKQLNQPELTANEIVMKEQQLEEVKVKMSTTKKGLNNENK